MFLYLLILIILFLFVVILFFSTRILFFSEKDEKNYHHRFELGLILNTVGLCFAFANSQKKIQIRFGKWTVLSRKMITEKSGIKKEKSAKKKKKKTLKEKFRSISDWSSSHLKIIKNHLSYIIKSFRNPKVNGNLELGFANPMHTGLFMGSYTMISEVFSSFQKNIVFQPVFTKSVANWQIFFSTDFILARIIWRAFLIWNVFRKIKK